MNEYNDMQDVFRPWHDGHEVKAQIVSQAQVDALVDWASHNAQMGVDIWVETATEEVRTWRIGCYGWKTAMPVTDRTKWVNENNIYDTDALCFVFEDRTDAMRFALLPEAGLVFGE